MSLTAISSLESTRRKFFMNSKVLHSGGEMSVTVISLLEWTRRKFSINSTHIIARK